MCHLGAIGLGDRDLAAVDRGYLAWSWSVELIVVALVALRADLATSAVAAEVNGLLDEVHSLLSAGVRCQDGQHHLLAILLARHGARHEDVGPLLAVRRPREALHLLLKLLRQPVLGRQ